MTEQKKCIIIDRSIMADLDILKTVPCATVRTSKEIRALLAIYNLACSGSVNLFFLAEFGKSLGYNPPANENDKRKMLNRWQGYAAEMNCRKILGEDADAVAKEMQTENVSIFVTTDNRKDIRELCQILSQYGILAAGPEQAAFMLDRQ